MTTALLLAVATIYLVWKFGPRRRRGPGFPFVYVNQDGSVREVSPGEQAYLSEDFSGGDSGRPYIKTTYESKDGWGSRSGFITRTRIPFWVDIAPVHPDYDAAVKKLDQDDIFASYRNAGYIIVTNEDGSVSCLPSSDIPRKKRFELARKYQLAEQQRREALAKVNR